MPAPPGGHKHGGVGEPQPASPGARGRLPIRPLPACHPPSWLTTWQGR